MTNANDSMFGPQIHQSSPHKIGWAAKGGQSYLGVRWGVRPNDRMSA